MDFELLEKIQQLSVPLLAAAGIELVDVCTRRQGRQTVIEILVDKPRGGITLDECARLNREIGDAVEVQNIMMDSYFLEVASPGLDRPLKTKKDFERVLHRPVRLILLERVGEKGEYIGEILEVNDQGVVIATQQGNLAVPFEKINVAKQHITL